MVVMLSLRISVVFGLPQKTDSHFKLNYAAKTHQMRILQRQNPHLHQQQYSLQPRN